MTNSNILQFSSRKRDRNHIADQDQPSHVVHEQKFNSFDGGGGTQPIVVQVILTTQDDGVEENKVRLKEKPVIGFWTTLIMALTFGFWLSG